MKRKPTPFSNRLFRELVDDYVQGERNRQILIRYYVDDLTLEELEEEFGVSVSQIKRIIKRDALLVFLMMTEKGT